MKALEKYLNDHLAGSGAALRLLKVLAAKNPADRLVYEDLHREVLTNRLFLEKLMTGAGFKRGRAMELGARATAQLAAWRFELHGMESGGLGLVESLEALEVGVHGQTLLWKTLLDNPSPALCPAADLTTMLERAEQQKAIVGRLRIHAVQQAFFGGGSPPA